MNKNIFQNFKNTLTFRHHQLNHSKHYGARKSTSTLNRASDPLRGRKSPRQMRHVQTRRPQLRLHHHLQHKEIIIVAKLISSRGMRKRPFQVRISLEDRDRVKS